MRVLLVSSEVAPYAKTGGLADVSGSLPVALAEHGVEMAVATPLYQMTGLKAKVSVPLGSHQQEAQLVELVAPLGEGVTTFFIKCGDFFDRPALYGYPDEAERYILFCRGVLELLKDPKVNWRPDLIHCNDWQTGLIPVYLKTVYASDPFCQDVATVFTIHNLAYQGVFPAETMVTAGLDWSLFNYEQLEFYGQVNFLKAGIVFSDIVTTVSPCYAQEIQTAEYGEGLDGVLSHRREFLEGILNGIDTHYWNPEQDKLLAHQYSVDGAVKGKRDNKGALQEEMGLPRSDDPLFAAVTRISEQKGLEILAQALERVLLENVQVVLLGSGEPRLEAMLRNLLANHPGKIAIKFGFDERLAHRIYAGADFFLMPSRYEPCGLGQMIALRYGALPVVRATGGLADTVVDLTRQPRDGNGFSFEEFSAEALADAMHRAIQDYAKRETFASHVARAMRQDFSWRSSASRYLDTYARALSLRQAPSAEQRAQKRSRTTKRK